MFFCFKKYFYLLGIILTLLLSCQGSHPQWGNSTSPNAKWQVLLHQKPRKMHQTPEILVYYKAQNQDKIHALGSIILPEDNRNTLDYHCEWRGDLLELIISCDYCMIEERYYQIDFGEKKPAIITQ